MAYLSPSDIFELKRFQDNLKFAANQPRHPAGSSAGGEFASSEGGAISKMQALATQFGYTKRDEYSMSHPGGNSITIRSHGTMTIDLRAGVKPKTWVSYYINVSKSSDYRSGRSLTALKRDLITLHPKEKG